MKSIGKFYRLIYINYILAKNGFDEIILATRWFAPISFLTYLNPWYWVSNRNKPLPLRMRNTLEELGPIFVKFGQMLSTRRDLLPDDFASELEKLQDRVAPFSGAQAIIEKTFGKPVNELFCEFEVTPLASASIAQVHAATLPDGHQIVVKVKRPGIEKIIKRDIELLYTFARILQKYTTFGKRARVVEIVGEFEHTILDELDLLREAANASILKRNFAQSKQLYIPEIYWNYCRENIMVMERIFGIPIYDIDALKANQVDLAKLAKMAVEIFFTQVFRDCFFHADMHPGNIFVNATDPNNPEYIAIDFGIMGTLTATDQRYLAQNLLAFFKRDYRRVAELHLESGWIPANTKIAEFESAISVVCEPIFQKPLKEISFGQLLLRLFQTGKRFHMEIQPQLLLLQKTLIHIESLGRQLCPDLDLWASAEPIVDKWVKQQLGPKAFLRKVKNHLPAWLERMPEMPDLIYNYLQQPKLIATTEIVDTIITKENNNSHFWQGFGICAIIAGAAIFAVTKYGSFTSQHWYYISGISAAVGVGCLLLTSGLRKLGKL